MDIDRRRLLTTAACVALAGTIGARQTETTPQGQLNGTIDDVRFYNRALSAAEVEALFLQGLPDKIYLPTIRRN